MITTVGLHHSGCFPKNTSMSTLQRVCKKLGFTGNAKQLKPDNVTMISKAPVFDRFDPILISRTENFSVRLKLRSGNNPYVTLKEIPNCYRLFIECT